MWRKHRTEEAVSEHTATIAHITRTATDHKAPRTLDVVTLIWDRKAYAWETEPGRYQLDQLVPINPPAQFGLRITPA